MTLRSQPLDALNEKFEDFGVVHALNYLAVDLAQHKVSLLVLEGVMETCLGTLLQTLNERSNLIHLCVRYLNHVTTVKRVD